MWNTLTCYYYYIFALVPPKERCKTPDSPEGARTNQTAPLSPTQSSPPRQPINGAISPVNNGSADSLTPPLPASTALSVNLDNSQSQQYTHGSYASCITRPLVKVKRFLSTLVQFGNDISVDIGERVRSLVLNLVVSIFISAQYLFISLNYFIPFQSTNKIHFYQFPLYSHISIGNY